MARLTSSGDWDSTFGNSGRTSLSDSGSGEAVALVIQPDRKILVLGISGPALTLARVSSHGALNPTFANEGQVRSLLDGDQISPQSIALQWNGKILISGRAVVGD